MQIIKDIFNKEFGTIHHKFAILEEKLIDLKSSKSEFIYNPGVYIFINNTGVIKVGRHLTNSRKRALEHIRDNTKNDYFEMSNMIHDINAKVILFNVKDPKDKHWVASVEIFLEQELNPIIKSKRY